jgi:integrase
MGADLAILGPDDGDSRVGELVAAWLAAKRSPHTRAAYIRDLAQWAGWLAGHGVPLLDADETAAAMWARYLEAAGIKDSTAARKLTAVSSFYSWCARRGHVRANPVAGLPRPAVDYDTSATPGLTRDQAIALLEAADADAGPQAARTAALASALLYTGARVSELLGADIEDLGTDRGHRVLRVRRKGGKIQALALPAPGSQPDRRLPGRPGRRDRPAGHTGRHGGRAAAPGAVRHRHRGADVPGRGPHPAPPPRPRRRPPRSPGSQPVTAFHAARLRHAEPGRRRQPARPAGRHGPCLPAHHPALRPQPRQPGPLPRLPARRVHQPRPLSGALVLELTQGRPRRAGSPLSAALGPGHHPAVPFWGIPIAPHMDVYVHARPVARSEARFLPRRSPGTGARPCPPWAGLPDARP